MTDLQTSSTAPAKPVPKTTEYLVSEVMEASEVAEAIAEGRIASDTTVRVELATHSVTTGAAARKAAIEKQALAEFQRSEYDNRRTYSAVADSNYEDWSPGEPKVDVRFS